MHLLHGYKFAPDQDRVISKNKKDILLVGMTLDKAQWNFKRYSKNAASSSNKILHEIKAVFQS